MGFAKLSLKGRALKYLAAREHSRPELERKLAAHEEEPGQLARVLDELEAKGLLSQARFVESLMHRKAARFGTARLRQELQAHGLDQDTMTEALANLRASEFDRARTVWQRKFAQAPTDAAERARQMRFLASRGFSAEVVRRVVRGGDED
jgi:regulatory protein